MRVPIPQADGYEASEDGLIFKDGKPVKINNLKSGYRVVNVRHNKLGWCVVTVARLVLEAFSGPKPPGYEARHIDENPSNCAAINLRWEPRGQNRIGRPHHPDTLGHALKDKRRARREAKQKVSELKAMKRELTRMARELGLDE